jgi:hypothetical protein
LATDLSGGIITNSGWQERKLRRQAGFETEKAAATNWSRIELVT